jgi:hypothetical protein
MKLPSDIPTEAVPILEEMGYLEPDTLHVGDQAPCLTLTLLSTSEEVVVGAPDASLPTVLVFGSYT